MRTNIEIDDGLMAKALATRGVRTKRQAVDAGLRLLVDRDRQQDILKLFGKIDWDGDLEAMRRD